MKQQLRNSLIKVIIPVFLTFLLYLFAFYVIIIPDIENNTINRKKELVVELTHSVKSILKEYYNESEKVENKEDIKKKALSIVEQIKYGKEDRGYFWIVDTNSMILAHPYSKNLVNVPPEDIADTAFASVLYNITRTIEQRGSGFINYRWQNKTYENEPFSKLAYVTEFKPWKWILGTGIYVDDIEEEVVVIKSRLTKISAVIIFVIALIMLFIIRQIIFSEQQKLKAEQQSKEALESYRTLFHSANDALLVLDENILIVDCNKKTEELQGYKREEIIGFSPIKFSPEFQRNGLSSAEYAGQLIKEAFHGEPKSVEWQLVNQDGSLKVIWITMSRFKLLNKLFILCILRDITDKKLLEQRILKATIKTEEKERVRFARELHDGLGPVISSIKLYFQWLAEVDDVNKKKEIIKKGNQNIEEAIQTLKEISQNLSPQILSNYGLEEALKSVINRFSELTKISFSLDVKLETEIEFELELTIYRILNEMINNSVKYSKANMAIIHVEEINDDINVTYSDNGIGFDLEKTLQSKVGTGLLNIKSRISTFGGEINLYSQANKGFKAQFKIPINEGYA